MPSKISNLVRKNVFLFGCILIILLEIFFFRGILWSDTLFGDSGDGRLNNLICEHWFQAFLGNESLINLNIFFPISNTISYTDMLLGFALPYSVLRLFSVNVYLANKIVLIGVHVFGSLSLFYLLLKKCRLHVLNSIAGVILFSYANGYYIKSNHTQLFAISFLPILLIFLINYFQSVKTKKRYLWGIVTAGTYALILYTSFYIGYFIFLFALIWGIIFVIVSAKNHELHLIWKFLRERILEILIIGMVLIIFCFPFLAVYLPSARLFGSRNYQIEVLVWLPNLRDYIAVSRQNLFWGRWMELINVNSDSEFLVGYPIITLCVFITVFFHFKSFISRKTDDLLSRLSGITACTVLVSWLIILRIGDFSLWSIIYLLLPGASSMRAIVRMMFFLTLPMAIVCAIWMEKKSNNKNLKFYGILIALLFLENISIGGVDQSWSMTSATEHIDAVAAPPENCTVFALIDTVNRDGVNYTDYQLDAWEIANKFHLKTFNGYSGQFPLDWNLGGPNLPSVIPAIHQWANVYGMWDAYIYDIGTNEWSPLSSNVNEYHIGDTIYCTGPDQNIFLYSTNIIRNMSEDGQYALTRTIRVNLFMKLSPPIHDDLAMTIDIAPVVDNGQTMIVCCNGEILENIIVDEAKTVTVDLPDDLTEECTIELLFPYAVPAEELGILPGSDAQISVGISTISIDVKE